MGYGETEKGKIETLSSRGVGMVGIPSTHWGRGEVHGPWALKHICREMDWQTPLNPKKQIFPSLVNK